MTPVFACSVDDPNNSVQVVNQVQSFLTSATATAAATVGAGDAMVPAGISGGVSSETDWERRRWEGVAGSLVIAEFE